MSGRCRSGSAPARADIALFTVTGLLAAGIGFLLAAGPGPITGSGPEQTIEGDPGLEQFRSRVVDNISLDTASVPPTGCDMDPAVYNTYTPDKVRWWTDPEPYRAETNSEGWRGAEEFSERPPANLTRVLVLGDSFTFGIGLNRTDTYPYQLERMLNEGEDGRYQVINAGVEGSAMPDYCSMLEHRGIQYHPDIVVVTFDYYDAVSRRQQDWIHRTLRERAEGVNVSEAEINAVEEHTRFTLYQQMELNETSVLPVYMDRIDRIARENEAETVFYSYRHIYESDQNGDAEEDPPAFIRRIIDQHDLAWIRAPPVFEQRPSETYKLADGHYDAWADRQLARHLYEELIDRGLLPSSGGP